jgi:hypothetical protein
MSVTDAAYRPPAHQCRKCKKLYDEGAERKRMIDTLIGDKAWQAGMTRLQLSRGKHDW